MNFFQREERIQTVCLLVLTIIALAMALRWLQPIMIPLVLAIFFSFGLSFAIDYLQRSLRFPRFLAAGATLLAAGLLFFLVALLVSASVRQLATDADAYQANISKLIVKATEALPLQKLGIREEDVQKPIDELSLESVGATLLGTANTLLTLLSQSFLVLLFLVFLMIGRPLERPPFTGVLAEIESRIKRYIITKAAISGATGFMVGLILWVLGVDLAIVFGLFAFLLNFIPNLGSIIATLLPVPVLLASPNLSTTTALLAILIPSSIQLTMGNLIEPRIMGQSLDLHPISILTALIFWGMLWGLPGMFLGVPITVVLVILFGRLEHTRPFAHLLAGRLDLLFNQSQEKKSS